MNGMIKLAFASEFVLQAAVRFVIGNTKTVRREIVLCSREVTHRPAECFKLSTRMFIGVKNFQF